MTIESGRRLAQYEITDHLGTGGMGEVYRARDLKLGRTVALKILPDAVARDGERVVRFEREARVLASLNHPNIAAIHDFQESGDLRFLVLELVEGETLAERLARGRMPIAETLAIARQICDALEAAHEKGVIHRDLKPANIKILDDGTVKVLDFGLAKVLAGSSAIDAAPGLSQSPTRVADTMQGSILGTAAYMSPEQAHGREADESSDVWAFGCVLHELLSGRRVFTGDSAADILSGVLREEPDWTRLPDNTPAAIRRLLHRCLQKDRRSRLRDIADARLEIDEAMRSPAPPAVRTAASRERVLWAAAVVATAIAVAFAARAFRAAPGAAADMRLQILAPSATATRPPVISPDGRQLAYAGQHEGRIQLWLRPLNSLEARPLPGTEDAELPFWSPDSRYVAFFGNGKLKRVNASTGTVETIGNAVAPRGGTWGTSDLILFTPTYTAGIYRLPASGGEAVAVTTLAAGDVSHRLPQFLPDGKHFLYYVQGESPGVYAASIDGGAPTRVTEADSQGLFVPPGFLLFVRQGRLFAQPFDPARLRLYDEATPLADRMNISPEAANLAAFSVSHDGTLIYMAGGGGENRQLAWFDRKGMLIRAFGAPESAAMVNPVLSPDGTKVAFNRLSGDFDVWILDTIRGTTSRLTSTRALDVQPIWGQDGTTVVFSSNRAGKYSLWRKDAGGGAEELLLETEADFFTPRDVSRDGRALAYLRANPETGWDIWVLPLTGDRKPFPVVATTHMERDPVFSPDGKWIAYQSDETGRFEIYAQPFPGPGGRVPISTNGGTQPRWPARGREILYIGPDRKLMAAPVTVSADGRTLTAESPIALFQTRIAGGAVPGASNKQQYDASPDGQRFIINTLTEEVSTSPITVMLNWTATLRR